MIILIRKILFVLLLIVGRALISGYKKSKYFLKNGCINLVYFLNISITRIVISALLKEKWQLLLGGVNIFGE